VAVVAVLRRFGIMYQYEMSSSDWTGWFCTMGNYFCGKEKNKLRTKADVKKMCFILSVTDHIQEEFLSI
jgi:hypothetical protein